MQVFRSNTEVKRVLRRQNGHDVRSGSSKVLSFRCLKAGLSLISVVSSLKPLFAGWRSSFKSFKNAPLKRVHVQLSGGHFDAIEDSIQAINEQE